MRVALEKTQETNKAIKEFLEANYGPRPVTRSIETYRRVVGESNDTFKHMLEAYDRSATV